jgi:hypothetical protein
MVVFQTPGQRIADSKNIKNNSQTTKKQSMNSTRDYTPEARKANHLRKIIDRIRVWEEKEIRQPKLTIYGDEHGNVRKVREEMEI